MINHLQALKALRTKLAALAGPTTGTCEYLLYTTVFDTPAWSLNGTPTRSAAAATVGGYPLDLVGDDSGAVSEQGFRNPVFTTAGTKTVKLLVKRSSAYASHYITLSDDVTPAWRLQIAIDFTAATPVVTCPYGTLDSVEAVDTGWRITATSTATGANSHTFSVIPADLATQAAFYLGHIEFGTGLAATATGYTRTAGSFLTDGFAPGMEVTPAGFAANPVSVITAVNATTLTVKDARAVEAVATGRSLSVALPVGRAWENRAYDPTTGSPWIEEDYLPGPMRQTTIGPRGTLEATPQYVVKVYGSAGTGVGGLYGYADALLTLFAPRTSMTLTNGDVLRVRTDPAPYRSQLQQVEPGWAAVVVTIPLRLETANAI